ncbi:hypothetical protein AMELA_G00018130, partial [Ameiurus melas]
MQLTFLRSFPLLTSKRFTTPATHKAGKQLDLTQQPPGHQAVWHQDTVNHQSHLSTLSSLGITGTVQRWVESYFSDRSFKVSWRVGVSETQQLTTGIPQGSVLGSLLFSIYTTSL